jgi:hypothetical protein
VKPHVRDIFGVAAPPSTPTIGGTPDIERDREAEHLLRRLIGPFVLRRTKGQVLEKLPLQPVPRPARRACMYSPN